MFKNILILFLWLSFCVTVAQAQNQLKPDEDNNRPSSIGELLTRAAIERAEANHRKLVSAAEELSYLAKGLAETAKDHAQLNADEQKKLGRIEKLAKQVRNEQGGGGSDDLENIPLNLQGALDRLQKAAELVEKETGRIDRHAVSVVLVEQLNEVLGITKYLKKNAK